MDAHDAREMALELMEQHGLIRDGWRFAWSRGRRQLGCVQIAEKKNRQTGQTVEVKTLRLSRPHAESCARALVRDTVLHEIAHALVGIEHGHDAAWKAMCRRIGAKPQRLANEESSPGGHKYEVTCGTCDRVLAKRYRRMAPDRLKRGYCRFCGTRSRGKLRLEPIAPADVDRATKAGTLTGP